MGQGRRKSAECNEVDPDRGRGARLPLFASLISKHHMFNTREKRERSLGTKLLLKGDRCASPKCAMVRRPVKPGVHGAMRRRALSEFGEQLKEMQKFKFTYGLRETYLRRMFEKAAQNPGVTGQMFVELLERRLDNVLFRLGFTVSRSVARQLVSHGHVMVNGRKVDIPSYSVRKGDVITFRPESKDHPLLRGIEERLKTYVAPGWLSSDPTKLEGKVTSSPRDFDLPFDVNLVVDYYSKMVK